jgi:hypothetical protein
MNDSAKDKTNNGKKEAYCADCGFKFDKSEMKEREVTTSFFGGGKVKKFYCLRCASRY